MSLDMAMNSPSSPIEATRNASMISAVMMARDREKAYEALDERERDRLEQERLRLDYEEHGRAKQKRGLFRHFIDWLPFS